MDTIRTHFAYATLLLALAGCGTEDGPSPDSLREALDVKAGAAGATAGVGAVTAGTSAIDQAGTFGMDPGNAGFAGGTGLMDSDAGEPTFGTAGTGATSG